MCVPRFVVFKTWRITDAVNQVGAMDNLGRVVDWSQGFAVYTYNIIKVPLFDIAMCSYAEHDINASMSICDPQVSCKLFSFGPPRMFVLELISRHLRCHLTETPRVLLNLMNLTFRAR